MVDFVSFSAPDEAAAAIQDFLRSSDGTSMPQDVQDKAWDFLKPGGSLSFAVAYFAELVYARKADISNKPALQLAAACAALGSMNGIDNLGGARGSGIMQQLRKKSGEKAAVGMGWQTPDDAPEPREQFLSEKDKPKPEEPAEEPEQI